MVKCEVLIGHLFCGHARRRKGDIVEMKPEAAAAAAKFGQVRVLGGADAGSPTDPPSRGASEGRCPPSRGASEGGRGVDEVDGAETGEGAGPTHRKKGAR